MDIEAAGAEHVTALLPGAGKGGKAEVVGCAKQPFFLGFVFPGRGFIPDAVILCFVFDRMIDGPDFEWAIFII